MKDINRKLLDGASRAMFNSNYLDMDAFMHAVELVVEDELRLYKDIEKMKNQPIHKEPITTIPEWERYRIERKTTDEEIRRMYQTTGVESTQNVTCATNEEINSK